MPNLQQCLTNVSLFQAKMLPTSSSPEADPGFAIRGIVRQPRTQFRGLSRTEPLRDHDLGYVPIAAGSSRCLSSRTSLAVSLQGRVLLLEFRELCPQRGRENRIVDGSHACLDQRNADLKNWN